MTRVEQRIYHCFDQKKGSEIFHNELGEEKKLQALGAHICKSDVELAVGCSRHSSCPGEEPNILDNHDPLSLAGRQQEMGREIQQTLVSLEI